MIDEGIDLELVYSARDPREYAAVRVRRRTNCPRLPMTDTVCERALEVQADLAARSEHRGASIPDLLIAACAEANSVTVLHYAADYDLIASVTGQPVEWIVPRGSVP